MGPLAIVFGLILALLGVGGYALTGAPTSLIPAAFGAVLCVLGFLARKDRLRMHVMHAAALVGLLGFLLPAAMAFPQLPVLLSEGRVLRPDGSDATRAVVQQTLMAVICLVFVALCVNSFVQARRRRAAAGTGAP